MLTERGGRTVFPAEAGSPRQAGQGAALDRIPEPALYQVIVLAEGGRAGERRRGNSESAEALGERCGILFASKNIYGGVDLVFVRHPVREAKTPIGCQIID